MDKGRCEYMGCQLGAYEKSMPEALTLPEKLRLAAAAGFDFMELSIDESDSKLARLDWTRQERQALSDAMWREKLPIRSICLSGHRKYPLGSENYETSTRSLEIMKKAIALASDLGVRIIQLAGYDEFYNASNSCTRKNFEANLSHCVHMASECSVMLAFETMETPFMDTVEKSMGYVKKINSPYLQVYPDIGNLTNAAKIYSTDVLQDLKAGRGHIAMVHLKETCPGRYRDMLFGEGHVDFKSCIQLLRESGVNMYTGELWYKHGADPLAYLKNAHDYLRKYLI